MSRSKLRRAGRPVARPRLEPPQTVQVDSLSHDGRGVARVNGKATFVWGALPGETAVVQVTKRSKGFDLAETQRLVIESVDRVTPPCPVFGHCGGCALQHLAAPRQIVYKQKILADNLTRIGRLADPPQQWLAPLTSRPWHYRRRARLALSVEPKD